MQQGSFALTVYEEAECSGSIVQDFELTREEFGKVKEVLTHLRGGSLKASYTNREAAAA